MSLHEDQADNKFARESIPRLKVEGITLTFGICLKDRPHPP